MFYIRDIKLKIWSKYPQEAIKVTQWLKSHSNDWSKPLHLHIKSLLLKIIEWYNRDLLLLT